MANTTAKYGFIAHEGPMTVHNYPIDPSTNLHYPNEVVDAVADAGIGINNASNAVMVGVIAEIFDSTGYPVKRYPGGNATGYTANVYDDPNQRYITKCDTALTVEDLFEYADITAGTASTVSYKSGQYISSPSASVAAVQVVGLAPIPGNAWGANQDVVVVLAETAIRKLS